MQTEQETDSFAVFEGDTRLVADKLRCPGGNDSQLVQEVDPSGSQVVVRHPSGHAVTIPGGGVTAPATFFIMDVEHRKYLKVRIGVRPRSALVRPVRLTLDFSRCTGTVPAGIQVVREDDNEALGGSVTGRTITTTVGEFSTYVLATPRQGFGVGADTAAAPDTTADADSAPAGN